MDICEEVQKYYGYEQLIKDVREVDEDAADYLDRDALMLPSFLYSNRISECFLWSTTPQGHRYWEDLDFIAGFDND